MRLNGIIKKWLYGSVPGFAGRFPYFGTKVFFPSRSHIFERACEEGIYEHGILSLLWKLVEPRSYYFDVGANIGLLSVPILRAFPECRVVSFEPSPNALPYLKRTASESDFYERWTVVGEALGAECSTTSFCVNAPSEGAFDGVRDTTRVKSKGTISVPMTTLDAVWQSLGSPFVSVIKIDVEGSESEVLKGAVNCLKSSNPMILLEWNASNLRANDVNPDLLLEFARNHDYSAFTAPNLTPVVNNAGLYLQMKLGVENYVLAPESMSHEPNHKTR